MYEKLDRGFIFSYIFPGGLLNIAIDTLLKRKVEDILVVPVNFSYDKLLEGNYIREQLGKTKVKESFPTAALGLWNSIQTKFGNARIDFGHPFSVKVIIIILKIIIMELALSLEPPSLTLSTSNPGIHLLLQAVEVSVTTSALQLRKLYLRYGSEQQRG